MDIVSAEQLLAKQNKQGWHVIFSGFVMYFSLGLLFCWGELMIYLYSYFRLFDDQASLCCFSFVFPIAFMFFQIANTLSERIINRFSIRKLIILCFLGLIFGLFICSLVHSYVVFIVFYSIMIGMSVGLLSFMPIVCGLRFFPENRGRVIGLINLGGAVGCLFIFLLTTKELNPLNIRPEVISKEKIYFSGIVAMKVPQVLQIIIYSFFMFAAISLCFLKNPSNWETKLENSNSGGFQSLRSKQSIGVQILLCLLSSEGLFFLIFYKFIGLAKNYSDLHLAQLGLFAVSLIFLTKILWNIYKNSLKALLHIAILQIISKFFLIFDIFYPIGILLEIISLGGLFSVSSRFLAENFDFKIAKKLNKHILILFGFSSILVCLCQGFFMDLGVSFFLTFLLKDLICLFLLVFFWKKGVMQPQKGFQLTSDRMEITEESVNYPPLSGKI